MAFDNEASFALSSSTFMIHTGLAGHKSTMVPTGMGPMASKTDVRQQTLPVGH